jgi:hypothetical protein
MRDYRVPKNIGGFNPQKLYAEILKSENTDLWYMQKHEDKTLITDGRALYIVPGRFPLADAFIEEKESLKTLIPKWADGVPSVDTKSEMKLTNKLVAKVFRKGEEDFYFDKTLFKYFTNELFEYRMPEGGKVLYVAYKGELIAMILGINVSK